MTIRWDNETLQILIAAVVLLCALIAFLGPIIIDWWWAKKVTQPLPKPKEEDD